MSKAIKIWLIVAASLVLAGCITFVGAIIAMKWDFKNFSTVKYETNSYNINEEYKNISVNTSTAHVTILPSENNESAVVCHEKASLKHSVEVKDGTLVIEEVNTRKWYEFIEIGISSTKITVYVPAGEYGSLSVGTSTGAICIQDISSASLELSVSTGSINVTDAICSEDVKITVSTGTATLKGVRCKNLTSSGDTGDLKLYDTIASEKITKDLFYIE